MSKGNQLVTLDKDLVEAWSQHQVTKLVWKKLCQDYQPHSALLTCKPDELGKLQGQAAILETLRTYFEC
jgi:hypothetical protein